ncbi:MAG: type II secretion system F family protein [Clostridiales bacterium]|nr:type II secretion system F family protein [Clostridiales bacterium]
MKKFVSKPLLSNTEIFSFCSQMAMILKSGISSYEGISIMLEESDSPTEKAMLQSVYDKLNETGSFYLSLEASGVFPKYMLHMTEIGEQSGCLDEVMDSLAAYYEREENISRSIKSAVSYPLLMIGMMTAIVFVLLAKVLPVFNRIFAQFGQEMTGFSRALLHMGTALNSYAAVLIVILIALVALFVYFRKTAGGRARLMKFCYHFRALRIFYDRTASCRFAGGMAFTLSSGLTPEYCMELVENLIENDFFTEKIAHCRKLMEEGCEFSAALTKSGIFSGTYARMASLAQRTGNLDTSMKDIAAKYEEEIDTHLTNMIALLEPTLVVILSVIVGFILLSVMLPLMGIMSGL